MKKLELYKITDGNKYLQENPEIFKRRILDKYLWLHQRENNINRPIDNEIYKEFLDLKNF